MATIDLAGVIRAGATALDEKRAFSIDRSEYLNASSATACIRRQWFERQPGARAQEDWGYAYRGSHMETYMVDALREALPKGWVLSMAGDEQQSIVSDEHRISATPDGFLDHEDGTSVYVEFKSIDPRADVKKLPREAHVTQVQIGMEIDALQEEGFAGCDYALLVYMDASNYNTIHTYRVERKAGLLDQLAPRAKKLLNAKGVANLTREGKASGECQQYGGCPFREQCGVEIEGPAKVTRGNRGSALDAAVRTYMMAKADEDLAKVAKAAAGEEIKQGLKQRNVTKLEVGNHVVELVQVAGRTTVDWKKAEANGLNLDPYKKIGSPGERLTVS